MSAVPDRISLTGLAARGFHGVFERERREGQEFLADIHLEVDAGKAAATDDLADTVDYGALAGRAVEIIGGEPADLIETVAERLADAALSFRGVRAVDVELHKPQAPIPHAFRDVSVRIRREQPGPQEAAGTPRIGQNGGGAPGSAAAAPGPGGTTAAGRTDAAPLEAIIALGANLGDPHAALQAAVDALRLHPHIDVTAVSGVYRTAPVGGVPDQPDFLNAAAAVRTVLSPHELLAALLGIEAMAGRRREVHHGPRLLDLDLIAVGGIRIDDDRLTLPHPRARERAFVLVPWADIDAGATLPDPHGRPRPITELAAAAPDRPGLRADGTRLVLD
ncbi:2-amino-4-hydroxy-6-hydroxymethyldihydropteridine diphosphokinase [Sediminivirga luteola]|uniref:2-amino-4-hydroxy-6- hydroxymethyldihydropteridine diphosphokinase n=1 Tax=Sediminivirga luteola TaxID=1774748 RepID=UPI001F578B75|nr:2-amino-4-hydroxy-6-hydroxymethyldihydropteridine diphosphokinase [Sediminivirga luteola]MCI2264769.1 2-amino-4-hydroxy-6-hydroxymethyldihydropteridine diphosphokinase [Sediminivirga luteola]